MSVRVRFAPSPTGKVHIGNIRAAIFNYLFARHEGGKFLLRVEDTDIERSTPEAIEALMEVMEWLGLDYDEEALYQTSQADHHLAMAKKLVEQGDAYYHAKGEGGKALLYRIPWNCDNLEGVTTVGTQEITVHPEVPVQADLTGLRFAMVSKKGKAVEQDACLAGFKDLEIHTESGEVFTLNDKIEGILKGEDTLVVERPARMVFTRRAIGYTDLVKGELAKPLDSMKDQVIVRSNGTPVFHLSNVCDDVTQQITHIVRGDDHVENTYRHLFLFQSLGAKAPAYAHLPMITNAQGKPYSKRDGDAFVGDFRSKGFLSEALFNYLTLLGWSPGDDREKMTRDEIIQAFSLDRVKSTAAQMDIKKLSALNGSYIAEIAPEEFADYVSKVLSDAGVAECVEDSYLLEVCKLMQERTTLFSDALTWGYFFNSDFEYNEKAMKKQVRKGEVPNLLPVLRDQLAALEPFTAVAIEEVVKKVAVAAEQGEFKLFPALRIALTGITQGAGVFEIAVLLGKEQVIARLQRLIGELD